MSEQIWEQATKLHLEKQYDEAEKLYDLILAQNPHNPGLLATIGTLYLQTNRFGMAIALLEHASKKQPTSDVLCNLAIAYKQSGQIAKAHENFEKAVKKHPTASALGNYAALFTNNGTPDKAISIARKAIKIDPDCTMAHWNMALSLLEKGEWEEAWKEHEWGFKSGMRVDREIPGTQLWDGKAKGKVAVYGEQGIGDEIMFATMLPDLMKTNEVVFECHKRLVHLFQEAFPDLVCIGTREDKVINWHEEHRPDYRISIGSLGQYYRNKREDFPGTPYLKAETAPRGDKFRVGISWTGGLKPGRVATRTVPLAWWKSILGNNAEFISLQYTDCKDEIDTLNSVAGYDIKQFDGVKAEDYYETAKLVMSCDLVISCCTSVIHLAGALGVPCWVMVPNRPAWRYGVAGPMPWYRSVRLYRQPAGDANSWMPVIQQVGYDLEQLIQSKERKAA